MRRSWLYRAKMCRADLSGADLEEVDLRGADLTGANLTGANLKNACLSGVDLARARGIRVAGPVGVHSRIIYGVAHGKRAMIKLGCWWGGTEETILEIRKRYGPTAMCDDYVAAVRWVSRVY